MAKKKTAKKNTAKKERIAPREAAARAARYYAELTGSDETPSIEEMELTRDENSWLVTLGYNVSLFYIGPKHYRLFRVNAYTGEVTSMKVRKL
jgi:hypothetical protein